MTRNVCIGNELTQHSNYIFYIENINYEHVNPNLGVAIVCIFFIVFANLQKHLF